MHCIRIECCADLTAAIGTVDVAVAVAVAVGV